MAHRPRTFLDVSIGEEPVGRLTIELFTDKTPKTCENFRQLCTGEHDGLSYAQSPFHRVIDEFMVQGGDIERGDGTGTASIYGGEFPDENLLWREMDAAGLLCAANRGCDTNGSQFFITLEPCPHLNGKHTIFGRLVVGEETLRKIAQVDVDSSDRPREPVLVSRCGELEKRKKRAAAAREERTSSLSRDRGRQGRDYGSKDVAMAEGSSLKDSQRERNRRRRQSDNVKDEGLRGRRRQRSRSRSHSRALSSRSASDVSSVVAVSENKRKRSASPSRHLDYGEHERRRRSLPNQYGEDRIQRRYDDRDRYKPSPRRDDYHHQGRWRYDGYRDRRDDYRSDRDVDRYDEGRLGGAEDGRLASDEYDPPVKFKGRGTMKYREQERKW